MSDALRRGIRTFLQAFVGTLALLAIPAMTDIIRSISNAEPYTFDVNFWQGVVVAAVLSGIIALIAWAQNALEDRGTVPAPLKAPASEGQNPVPNDGGTVA